MIKVLPLSGFQVTCGQPLWEWSRGGLCRSLQCHPSLLAEDDLAVTIVWIPGYSWTTIVRMIQRGTLWKFTVSSKVTYWAWFSCYYCLDPGYLWTTIVRVIQRRTVWRFTVSSKVTSGAWFSCYYCLDSRLLLDNHCEGDPEGDCMKVACNQWTYRNLCSEKQEVHTTWLKDINHPWWIQ